jgi:hypothetical protein
MVFWGKPIRQLRHNCRAGHMVTLSVGQNPPRKSNNPPATQENLQFYTFHQGIRFDLIVIFLCWTFYGNDLICVVSLFYEKFNKACILV